MGIPHFLVIPYPVQGHVNPLMQFSEALTKHGCKISFLNTEFNQKRGNNSSGGGLDNLKEQGMRFVTLPDGLDEEDDRSDHQKVLLSIKTNMPGLLPKLVQDINALDAENNITCIVATMNMGWALEFAHKLGIKGAFMWTASAASLAACYCIPRLIHDGIIDSEGVQIKKQDIQLSPSMPMMDAADLPWGGITKIFFPHIVKEMKTLEFGEWWLCNTTSDLEPGAVSISPRFLPIGPLMETDTNRTSFWEEDTTCLTWLDQQPPQSVVYVSFGSLATLEPNQFKELAIGLDLLKRPFLWVVRPSDHNKEKNTYPDEFHGRKGKIVNWAPQKKILNHPAIACFISHCGWNSTMEGVFGGVPFLCWPFFSDQFINRSYICDVWKVGLKLEKDENGLILKGEIRKKVDQVLENGDIKAASLKLKELFVDYSVKGSKNLQKFINWAK